MSPTTFEASLSLGTVPAVGWKEEAVLRASIRFRAATAAALLIWPWTATGQSAAMPQPPECASQVGLGARLFFDRRMSVDGSISCADCHLPEQAFSDGRAVAKGVGGRLGSRNTPSLINAATLRELFWDGRRDSLASQARDPLTNPREHGLADMREALVGLEGDEVYAGFARQLFGAPALDAGSVATAIAAFEATLVAFDSPFDRWRLGNPAAMPVAAIRGYALFVGAAGCSSCHRLDADVPQLTDGRYHAPMRPTGAMSHRLIEFLSIAQVNPKISAGDLLNEDPSLAVLGRFLVTRDIADIGAIRTPGLRNVAVTAPYFHDGSVETLAEAVERELGYARRSQRQGGIVLTALERSDLVEFLTQLTSESLDALALQVRHLARVTSTCGHPRKLGRTESALQFEPSDAKAPSRPSTAEER